MYIISKNMFYPTTTDDNTYSGNLNEQIHYAPQESERSVFKQHRATHQPQTSKAPNEKSNTVLYVVSKPLVSRLVSHFITLVSCARRGVSSNKID